MTRAPELPRRRPIIDRLSDEWTHLALRAADLDAVRTWGLPGATVTTLDDVLDRCGYARSPSTRHGSSNRTPNDTDAQAMHDAYLIRVLTIARHDPLAARIVLQRILGPLSALARNHASTTRDQNRLLDDLVANSWSAIRGYPVERRPHRVVPNLVRDIGFQTIVRPARRRSADELPTDPVDLRDDVEIVHVEPLEELIELLVDARNRGVGETDIELICRIVSMDRPTAVAELLAVSSRTVRNRRDAIVHRLREVVATAA